MSYELTVRSPVCPGRAELLGMLDAAAWANARWFLVIRKLGREAPCCIGCTGLHYVPDRPSRRVRMLVGDELVRRGRGSCGEVAAFELGRRRADAMLDARPLHEVAELGRIELVDGPDAETFHAIVVLADGTTIDPTKELAR